MSAPVVPAVLAANSPDSTNLHTVGLRGHGVVGALDFEAEVAYQFGDANAEGTVFVGEGSVSPYGPKDPSFDNWGANLEVGYTFDVAWQPRAFVGGAYFGGEDNRGPKSFREWLDASFNPHWRPKASVSFNRLFSSWEYSEFMENTDMSNAWIARWGVVLHPTEPFKVSLLGMHCATLEPFRAPGRLPFITHGNDTDMGWEAEIIANYGYSPDLLFEAGYAHMFVESGLREGGFSSGNGLIFNGGTAKDDADYVYFETKLSF